METKLPSKSIEYQREWRKNNSERLKKVKKAWHLKNKTSSNKREMVYYYVKKKQDPERLKLSKRKSRLLYRYGLTLEEYDKMAQQQHNRCGICKQIKPNKNKLLVVDHNHKTGKVRGLLCIQCNSALGYLKENVAIAQVAFLYLAKDGVKFL